MLGDFGIDASALDGATVLVASYDTPPYEGCAFVLFERDGQIYEVNGSHCSCYGLSEYAFDDTNRSQWNPEIADAKALLYRATAGHIIDDETSEAVIAALNARAGR